ncbi:response regulator transcription factor [Halomonas sp. ATBC28]|uniref:Response regulator transcription factor n=2 Tax=Vreelandella TaxID=3137766 RepID=A0A7Z0N8D8_9GAMM|nr:MULTISPECIES: response regulator transcription factor [Halomonas]NYT73545.1 response regulator transcription factor [Halomonas sedimenti]TMU27101.1 response regulator transcription factor [Halomonas sp. ATBC28]TVU90886.1 response regulator transcription factor [Halomonas titanicae]|tara:strand:+ start:20799 stop:21464 length:666 start_codon:yes stop_codon:yes gene_type:complete
MDAILLVEDDHMLGRALSSALGQEGWRVVHCKDVASAHTALVDHAFVAVLLDLGLPGGSGLEVLSSMRSRYDPTPVLIITARDQLSDRVRGLDVGADDYIVKPFQRDEMLARLRAVLRRSRGAVTPVLRWRDVEIDPAARVVTREGQRISLSAHEFRLLLALFESRGRVLSRDQLQDRLYGDDTEIGSNTVAVFVHQLRRKLGDGVVVTELGFGYRLGDEH